MGNGKWGREELAVGPWAWFLGSLTKFGLACPWGWLKNWVCTRSITGSMLLEQGTHSYTLSYSTLLHTLDFSPTLYAIPPLPPWNTEYSEYIQYNIDRP